MVQKDRAEGDKRDGGPEGGRGREVGVFGYRIIGVEMAGGGRGAAGMLMLPCVLKHP